MISIVFTGIPIVSVPYLQKLVELHKRGTINLHTVILPAACPSDCSPLAYLAKRAGINYRFEKGWPDTLTEDLQKSPMDLLLSTGYDCRIPKSARKLATIEAVNVHAALLPDYRGANPYFWIIRNGEDETGITFHRMTDQLDGGEIITQLRIPIPQNEVTGKLVLRCAKAGANHLPDFLQAMTSGDYSLQRQEPTEKRKIAPRVSIDYLQIKAGHSTADLLSLIRAANPYYGAILIHRKKIIKIWQAEAVPMVPPDSGLAGQLFRRADTIYLQTSDGVVKPTHVTWENIETGDNQVLRDLFLDS